MHEKTYRPGDAVVYRASKCSTHPGPRARSVDPAPRGDTYSYYVDKFWIVADALEDGTLVLQTRRGKTHRVNRNDPRLHRATWLERLLYRSKFPAQASETVDT